MPAATGASGSKRKKMGDIKYYAVQTGHRPGVYTNWNECLEQIRGFKGAKFKSFTTPGDAQMFLTGKDPSLDPTSSSYTAKFYGVRSGKVPGVYTDWATAEEQVKGVQKPKVRAFPTRAEAEAFVACGATVAKGMPEVARKRSAPSSSAKQKQQPVTLHVEHTQQPPQRADEDFGDELEKELEMLLQQEASDAPVSDGYPAPKKRRPIPENGAEREVDEKEKEDHRVLKPKPKKLSPVLKIYTDGSSLSNGRAGANAGVGVWFGDRDARNISEPLAGPRQTNQRAELTAILRAINVSPTHRDVLIFTDSQYSIKCVTVWHHAWIRNNWNTTLGRPVENRDLVEQIIEKIREREKHGSRTRFEWVKGHSGQNDGNHQADRLAVEGAMKGRNVLVNGNC